MCSALSSKHRPLDRVNRSQMDSPAAPRGKVGLATPAALFLLLVLDTHSEAVRRRTHLSPESQRLLFETGPLLRVADVGGDDALEFETLLLSLSVVEQLRILVCTVGEFSSDGVLDVEHVRVDGLCGEDLLVAGAAVRRVVGRGGRHGAVEDESGGRRRLWAGGEEASAVYASGPEADGG